MQNDGRNSSLTEKNKTLKHKWQFVVKYLYGSVLQTKLAILYIRPY